MNGMDEWQTIQNEKIRLMRCIAHEVATCNAEIDRLCVVLERIIDAVDDMRICEPLKEIERMARDALAKRRTLSLSSQDRP